MKLKSRGTGIKPMLIWFGEEVAALVKRRPATGPLFPYLRTVRAGDRATEFNQRCDGLGIKGVSLHSSRYGWADRALKRGYPERFAQQALGHNSKAVHHPCSKHAEVTVPLLETGRSTEEFGGRIERRVCQLIFSRTKLPHLWRGLSKGVWPRALPLTCRKTFQRNF